MIYILLASVIATQIYIIIKFSKKDVTVHKVVEKKLTEEEKAKQKKMREHFENLMDYDYEKALKKE